MKGYTTSLSRRNWKGRINPMKGYYRIHFCNGGRRYWPASELLRWLSCPGAIVGLVSRVEKMS